MSGGFGAGVFGGLLSGAIFGKGAWHSIFLFRSIDVIHEHCCHGGNTTLNSSSTVTVNVPQIAVNNKGISNIRC
jgi:hypothetical protein